MELIIVLIYLIGFNSFPPVLCSYTRMIHVPFFCFFLPAGVSSTLRILDKRPDCNQQVRIQSIKNKYKQSYERNGGKLAVLDSSSQTYLVFFQGLDNCKISKYLICQISRIKFKYSLIYLHIEKTSTNMLRVAIVCANS